MEKDFESWNIVKQKLDSNHQPPFFKEREIWWCSIGINIGFEIYGKGVIMTRPVLILKKFSHTTFLSIPLTSKAKEGKPFCIPFSYKGKDGSVLLDQIRTMDSRRLAQRMGRITENQFETIKQALIGLL